MRYHQIVQENFNDPLPYTWAVRHEAQHMATFRVGKLNYAVSFTLRDAAIGMWECQFALYKRRLFGSFKISTGLTNTGSQFTIFATIFACIKDFIHQQHPPILFFTAKGDLRDRLYQMLLKRFAPDLARLGYTSNSGVDPTPLADTLYVLASSEGRRLVAQRETLA